MQYGVKMAESGARRKVPTHQTNGNGLDQTDANLQPESINMNSAEGCMEKELPKIGFRKREKRHIYHDILPLKTQVATVSNPKVNHFNCNGGESALDSISSDHTIQKPNTSVKPAVPPKPKYILRDKKVRHVYQSINLSTCPNVPLPPPPPPLPVKPLRLLKLHDRSTDCPPPLPPRVINTEAIQQRHRLDQQYFENLRKSVDEELLGIAEEGDLPVPLNLPASNNMQTITSEYGAHSPPLILNDARSQPNISSPRRHSLPTSESSDFRVEGHRTSLTRANSNDAVLLPHTVVKNEPAQNLTENFTLLKRCGWYWGNMSWQDAEELLSKTPGSGVFLVRDSHDPRHLLTITVRSTTNTIHHVRVEYCEGKFQLFEPGRSVSQSTAQCVRHSNIEQFINLAVRHSISGSFLYFLKPKNMGEPPVQIQLLTPISRFSNVKSLRYLCRIAIRERVVGESISSLPVPSQIQQYLKAGPYFDPNEENVLDFPDLESNSSS